MLNKPFSPLYQYVQNCIFKKWMSPLWKEIESYFAGFAGFLSCILHITKRNKHNSTCQFSFIKLYVTTLEHLKLNKNSLDEGRIGSGYQNTTYVLYAPLGNFQMHIFSILLTHSINRMKSLVTWTVSLARFTPNLLLVVHVLEKIDNSQIFLLIAIK